jgi:hypothetical protein
MLNLLLVAYRCVDLRADHAADVNGCCANSSTRRMDQDTLQKIISVPTRSIGTFDGLTCPASS